MKSWKEGTEFSNPISEEDEELNLGSGGRSEGRRGLELGEEEAESAVTVGGCFKVPDGAFGIFQPSVCRNIDVGLSSTYIVAAVQV